MSKLNVIGTPLGNLEDITLRALRVMFESDLILAEDTRSYTKLKGLLLQRFPTLIENKHQEIFSYRDQNHGRVMPVIINRLEEGRVVSLVSDAGMPGISDPGFKLIRELIDHNIEIDVLPGGTAADTALLLSGFPTDRFTFLGFLPRIEGKIVKIIEKFIDLESTLILYESPFRVIKTLEIINKNFEDIEACVCNEMTKMHQNIFRGKIEEVVEKLKSQKMRGEYVIVIRKK